MNQDEGRMVALTEQGDLGLGVHQGQNENERELLKQKLAEIEQQNKQKN